MSFFNPRKTGTVAILLLIALAVVAIGLLAPGLTSAKSFVACEAITHSDERAVAMLQDDAPQVQELTTARPAATTQDRLHGSQLERGSALEFRDGRMSCRALTKEEARAMWRGNAPRLSVIDDESFSANSPEQARKGLKIILRGSQQLEQFPEAKAAFLRAAHAWESLIQNPITVVIDVDFGPTAFGQPFGEKQVGLTRSQDRFQGNAYPIIRAALIRSAGSPQEAALYNSLPEAQLPTDLGATTGMIFHVPAMRALGLFPPVPDPDAELETLGLPPAIAFNSAESYDFDQRDGIKPKKLDFTAFALHEIGHALGFSSGVGIQELHPEAPPQMPDTLDLFRFRPGVTPATFTTAPRILSSGGEHIFFDGGPELPFSTGRNDRTGGDGQQAEHWKDDGLTGPYIGIMDPVLEYATRYEITANDLRAFESIGYRMNPLLNPQEAELKADDGELEGGASGNGWIVVKRLTPPAYPATLRKLRILIPSFAGQPDPRGKPITLLIGASNGQLPAGAQFRRIETTVPSASLDLFLEFTIPDGPTIASGDFYAGYQVPAPFQGVGFAVDLSDSAENRSFYSSNNGASFAPLTNVSQTKTANAMIRAIVSTPSPTPTPTPVPTPTPTPGPDTVALTSGVQQNGHMIGSSPYGVRFITQYTIQVPSGAKQLKIDLNANTDLDLFARFGGRVAVENGNLVADFISESDNFSESITVTPASSPALQAGVYYLAIVNYGPGSSTFSITATITGGSNPTPNKVASVSAASFNGEALAPDEMVAAFGAGMATGVQAGVDSSPEPGVQLPTTLLGTTVKVTDSAGTERAAPLFFVSPSQINYLIPADTALGTATVTVTSGDGTLSVGTARIERVAPGIFTANGDAAGVPAALALRYNANGALQSVESVFQFDQAQRRFVPRPLSLGEATDQVFLILYGAGLRHRQSLSTVSARIGGVTAPVAYAGAQSDFAGLDQINALLPRSLIGRGEVEVEVTVDGKAANKVRINIR